ncbi:MAG: lactate utilization protein [Humidesulfovibrio sp.]|nr:lactate utilization protein [Humidesulfovibrio sp.]
MDAPLLQQREKLATHLIKQLGHRRMAASFHRTAAEAKDAVLALIPSPARVSRCGSESAGGLGLWAAIAAKPGVTLMDPYAPGLTPADGLEVRRQGLLADVLVTSTNALTLDGRLVNLDGSGNRVAGMLFGPQKVLLLVGMNKVVADLEAAFARVRTIAAPANNIRLAGLGLKNPCIEDGRCHNCRSETRICNAWTIIEGSSVKDRIHVVLVGEDLGY